MITVDALAQISRLNKVNPSLKFWTALVLMALCVSAPTPAPGMFLILAVPTLAALAGGLRFCAYLRMLVLPLSFLTLGAIALLLEVLPQPGGMLAIPVFNIWLCVTKWSLDRTGLVMARSLGAVSCLYLLSLTTPMAELIGVLRRARCPGVITELMYLIYRYIFILLSMHHTMHKAAKSRLGDIDYRTSMRTTGSIYAALLSRSYRQAGANFDAMESRCYSDGIRFLENVNTVAAAHVAAAIGMIGITLALFLY